MSDLERALDACLEALREGRWTLDECLAQYPAHEAELRPRLLAALAVQKRLEATQPSPEFAAAALGRAPEVRGDVVVGDAEEPGRERHVLPPKVADGPEHLQEHLFGQILRLRHVAQAGERVAVDAGHVPVVEVGQGLLVAGAGAFDRVTLGFHRDAGKGRGRGPGHLVIERRNQGHRATVSSAPASLRHTPPWVQRLRGGKG